MNKDHRLSLSLATCCTLWLSGCPAQVEPTASTEEAVAPQPPLTSAPVEALQSYDIAGEDFSVWEPDDVDTDAAVVWMPEVTPSFYTEADDFPALPNALAVDQGGVLAVIASEENDTSYAASNVVDSSSGTYWRSYSSTTNDLVFDINSAGNEACFDQFHLENYGSSSSVRRFSLLTASDPTVAEELGAIGWTALVADAAPTGDLNYGLWDEGGRLVSATREENNGGYAAENLNDGNNRSYWRAWSSNVDELRYRFDRDWDGEQDDNVSLQTLELSNMGNSYAVERFQVEARHGGTTTLLEVPGSAAGDADFRFSSSHEGAVLEAVNVEEANYPASRAVDDNERSYWRFWRGTVAELDLAFDTDMDGTTGADGDDDDAFSVTGWDLNGTGGGDSVRHYQVELQHGVGGAWTKVAVPGTAAGDANFNHASRFEGGIVTDVSHEEASDAYLAVNALDENTTNVWRSYRGPQELDVAFDGDLDGTSGMDGDTDDKVSMTGFSLAVPDSGDAVRYFQVLSREAGGSTWTPVPVPGTAAGDADFNFASQFSGGQVDAVSHEENGTSYAAANAIDGNVYSIWRSYRRPQSVDLSFDPNFNDTTGNEGDATDRFTVEKLAVTTTNSSNAVQQHQFLVKRAGGSFAPVPVPGSAAGDADFNFASQWEGAVVTRVDNEENNTTLAAANLFDDNPYTYWRSFAGRVNEVDVTWDTDFDGTQAKDGDVDDAFELKRFQLNNYNSDNSVKDYQLLVRTHGSSTWTPVPVPGAPTPTNLLSRFSGGLLTRFTHEETSYPAVNVHDDNASYWRHSRSAVSEVEFSFDTDGDGLSAADGDADDAADLAHFVLSQVGNSYSLQQVQIEIETQASGGFFAVDVPGTAAGDANFDHALAWEGGVLVGADATTSSSDAADNALNGNPYSRWRDYGNRVSRFAVSFDGDRDGTSAEQGDTDDAIELTGLALRTSTNSYRVRQFAAFAEVGGAMVPLTVPGSTVGDANFNYLSTWEGGRIQSVSSPGDEDHIHDGNPYTYASFSGAAQTIEFAFDPELDGSADTEINFATLRLFNYGDGRGLQDFELDVLVDGTWNAVPTLGGGTVFTAAQATGAQDFILPLQQGVDAVRLRTLSNYGSSTLRFYEMELFGTSVGPSRTFIVPDDDNTDWTTTLDAPIANVEQVELQVLRSNSSSRKQLNLLRVLGTAKGPAHVFDVGRQGDAMLTTTTPLDDVIAVRLRAINNHGGWRAGLREFKAIDASTAPNTVFSAPRDGVHDVVLDAPVADVVEARIRFLSHHGGWRVAARGFKLMGDAVGPAHVFTAARNAKTTHTLSPAIADVEAVRLVAINNHGGWRNELAEVDVLGPALSPAYVFEINRGDDMQVAMAARDVDEVRLQVLQNHGGWRNQVSEFRVLGPALRPSYTFIADRDVIDEVRLPAALTDVRRARLRVQSNHLGWRTRVEQFDLLGPALGPTHTFEPAQSGVSSYTLPAALTDVSHVTLRTIDAFGGSRIAAREFRMLGAASGPSYVFSAPSAAKVYGYDLDTAAARVFRFHHIDEHGSSRVAARDMALVSTDGACPDVGPAVQLTLGDNTPLDTIGRGQSDEPLVQVRVLATTETINGFGLQVHTEGTGDEFADTNGIKLWQDVDEDGTVSMGDIEVAADVFVEDNESITFAIGTLPAMEERHYLVALDLNLNPANGRTFRGLLGGPDVIGTGATSGKPARGVGTVYGDVLSVVDVIGPTVQAPLTVGYEATSPDGRNVRLRNLGTATATDDGTGRITIERRLGSPTGPVLNSSHHVFPLGTTLVYWVGIDDAGNEGYAFQQVRIVDTTPPVIASIPTTTQEATSPLGTPVDDPAYVVTDVADAFPVVTNDAPDLFPLGDTVVTATATDASSNVATRPYTVRVVDTTPPVFEEADGSGKLPVVTSGFIPSQIVLPEPVVTDNGYSSSALTIEVLTPAPDSPGLLTVTWRAVDPDGNEAFATQDVYFLVADEALVINTTLLNKNQSVAFGEYHSAAELAVDWQPQGVAPYTFAFNVVPDEISVAGDVHTTTYSDEKRYAPVLGHFTDSAALPKFNFKLAFFGIDRTFPVVESTPMAPELVRLDDAKTYDKLFYGENIDLSGFQVSDVLGNGVSGLGRMRLEFNAKGPAQQVLAFDGDSVVVIPHDRVLEPTEEFTLEAWIRTDHTSLDEGKVVIMKGDTTLGDPKQAGFMLVLNKGKLETTLSDGTVSDGLVGTVDVTDGAWHHVAVVRAIQAELNGVAIAWSLKLVVDGVVDVEKAVEPFDLVSASAVRVGKGVHTDDGFVGHIDDVALHMAAFDEAQLAHRYNRGIGMFADVYGPTVLMLRFDQDSGQTVVDEGGYALDGTLGATAASDVDDPVRESPLGAFGDYELAADNAIAIAGGTNLVYGPPAATGVSCDQGVLSCPDGNTTIEAQELGDALGKSIPHRVDVVGFDRAGNAARSSSIVVVDDLEGMVADAIEFIDLSVLDFDYMLVQPYFNTARQHLVVAQRYLNLQANGADYRYVGGATLRAAKAVQSFETAHAILFGDPKVEVQRMSLGLARATLGDSRVRLEDLRPTAAGPDVPLIANSDVAVTGALAFRAGGQRQQMLAAGRLARNELALLIDAYADYRANWLDAENNPDDYQRLLDMIAEMTPLLVTVIDAQIEAVQNDPATPVQDQLQTVRDRIDDIRGCTVLLEEFNLEDDEFVLCYLDFVEIGEVLQDVQGNLVDTYAWKAGTAQVLFGLLRISLQLSPYSMQNIIDGAGLPPQADYDDALTRYNEVRAILDDGDIDTALEQFIAEKCRVVDLYNTYYTPNSLALIPNEADNVSEPLDPVLDPSTVGCAP